jgi:hypothetical protein
MRDSGRPMPHTLGRWVPVGRPCLVRWRRVTTPPAATTVPSGTMAAGPPPGTALTLAAAGGEAAGRCCDKAAAVQFEAEEPPEAIARRALLCAKALSLFTSHCWVAANILSGGFSVHDLVRLVTRLRRRATGRNLEPIGAILCADGSGRSRPIALWCLVPVG